MNLELLFFAAKNGASREYYDIAVSHARKTMENQFRLDGSNNHVALYDTHTGQFLRCLTNQGFSDNSMWARGQAWAIYGFTVCYRYTKDKKYLDQAVRTLNMMLRHPNMPNDLVPYWDLNAPNIPNEPRDVSTAACIASALYEMDKYLPENGYHADDVKQIAQDIAKEDGDKWLTADANERLHYFMQQGIDRAMNRYNG